MFDQIRTQVLRLLRVPPDPEPPAGAPGSLRVFRAGRNLYQLRLVSWTIGQLGALIGIIVSVGFLHGLQVGHAAEKLRIEHPAPQENPIVAPSAESPPPPPPRAEAASDPAKPKPPTETKRRSRGNLRRIVEATPSWIFFLLQIAEFFGILAYLAQIPLTYAMVRLDYELRWYLVTDRSLRIRTGLTSVQESTMSFANLQQVVVTQGPLQRLLGIADVRVQSAGGGGDTHAKGAGESLHTGVFHGVDNANEIRDLILDRLRQFRESGLGDPDEPAFPTTVPSATRFPAATLAAAGEVLAEARALRRTLN